MSGDDVIQLIYQLSSLEHYVCGSLLNYICQVGQFNTVDIHGDPAHVEGQYIVLSASTVRDNFTAAPRGIGQW